MAAPYTLNNSIRVHDKAVMDWLAGLRVDYGMVGVTARDGVPILAVFSTPDRAFADVQELLVLKGWIDGATNAEKRTNAALIEVTPLPIVSVSAADPTPDPELADVAQYLRVDAAGPNKYMQMPGHYRREYTINFWCSKRYTDNFVREWVMSQFGPRGASWNERFLMVDHGSLIGQVRQSFKLFNGSDLSALEGPEPVYKRVEYTLSLRFWLMRPIVDGPV